MFLRAISRVILALAVLAASFAVVGSKPERVEAAPLVPAANIKAYPAYPSICHSSPTSLSCEDYGRRALNRARALMGLPAYNLPKGFATLPAYAQLLILSDQDRAAYGLGRIKGTNHTLNLAALDGVLRSIDPIGVTSLLGYPFRAWASNWAAGYKSPMYTYYEWMYNDGPGGTNVECTYAGQAGCWGHRLNTLRNFGSGVQVVMGAASGPSLLYGGAMSFTELYESFSSAAPIPVVPVVTGFQRIDATRVYVRGYSFRNVRAVYVAGKAMSFRFLDQSRILVNVPRGTSAVQVQVYADGIKSHTSSLSVLRLT